MNSYHDKSREWTYCWSLILLTVLLSCNEVATGNKPITVRCSPLFFRESGKYNSDISSNYFKTDSIVIVNDSVCGYWYRFGLWIIPTAIPIHQGVIYYAENSILFLPQGDSSGYKLFDFDLSLNMDIPINYVLKYPLGLDEDQKTFVEKKTYDLLLEDTFFDYQRSDTVYKFRFRNYNPIDLSEDIVFWVGKQVGVVGIYITTALPGSRKTELIRSYIGEIYFERIDTAKVEIDPSKFDFL